jgi:hypothetical protein
MPSLLVIYAYYEEGREQQVHDSYNFFMKYGYYESPIKETYRNKQETIIDSISYVFVISGKCTMKLIEKDNIIILYRNNGGYDFGAFKYAIDYYKDFNNYDYYFFLNSSVRGPFTLPFCKVKWFYPFLDLYKNDVKLVGPSINPMFGEPHVQTYSFLIDNKILNDVRDKVFDKVYTHFMEIVMNQEVGLSKTILSLGWNISSLIPEQQDIDYRDFKDNPKYQKMQHKADLIWTGSLCNGRDLHPYELIFFKFNRNLSLAELNSLSHYYLENLIISPYIFNNPYEAF